MTDKTIGSYLVFVHIGCHKQTVFRVLDGKDGGQNKDGDKKKKKKEQKQKQQQQQQLQQLPMPVVKVNGMHAFLVRESGSLSRRWPRT